ncbi:hypothetical protein, partial [Pseudomonas syringae]|uniref:hypothetical protein n=1 Tax=Pseudomonas syringae TaxID=317 RepID=UPI000357905F
ERPERHADAERRTIVEAHTAPVWASGATLRLLAKRPVQPQKSGVWTIAFVSKLTLIKQKISL